MTCYQTRTTQIATTGSKQDQGGHRKIETKKNKKIVILKTTYHVPA